ncbi:MAG TPA: hypothetical protein VOB72_06710 [Candidatus Dormibacteraeota bacterium]|nr:hypothetical protein [Candidatus Dormibacteraeota bacterium]
MSSAYRRILLATLGTLAVLAVPAVSSGAAMAADPHAVGTSQSQNQGSGNGGGNGNGVGGNGHGGGGGGQGTATPELPSGVLFGIGLIPLGAGLFLLTRRRRTHA